MQDIKHSNTITHPDALRKLIPSYPAILDKRIKDSLDDHCLEFISYAALIVVAIPDATLSPFQLIDPKNPDSFVIESRICLRFKMDASLPEGKVMPTSLYCLIPGVNHGLRINGRVITQSDNTSIFYLEQVYFHCGRAAIRSELWQTNITHEEASPRTLMATEFLEQASYFLLATRNQAGATQLSPRGDMPGHVQLIKNGATLFLPERPGNKVAISLRNILENPSVALWGLVPGLSQTLCLTGQAHICDDPTLLALCAVNNATPKLGIAINIDRLQVEHNATLATSNLWHSSKRINESDLMPFSKVLSEHMMGSGIKGRVTHLAVKTIVEKDKKQLY